MRGREGGEARAGELSWGDDCVLVSIAAREEL